MSTAGTTESPQQRGARQRRERREEVAAWLDDALAGVTGTLETREGLLLYGAGSDRRRALLAALGNGHAWLEIATRNAATANITETARRILLDERDAATLRARARAQCTGGQQ